MTRWLGLLLLATVIGGSAHATQGTKISAGTSDYQAGLGDGWDANKQYLKGRCLVGEPKSEGTATSTVNFEQKIEYDQLEKELGFGAAGRARFGVVSTSASAKFLSNSKSDAFSIAATYVGTYQFKNLTLTAPTVSPEMKPHLGHDERWDEACGTEYVQQMKLGAKIFFTIRIDFSSEAEKKSFEAAFSVSAPLWGVSGNFKTASSSLSTRTKVTITTLQVGGEVDKISAIFGTPDNVVQCSIGKFEVCGKVLDSALQYATQEFPKQIAKETMTAQLGTGPVVIEYLTKPYSAAGIFPKNAPQVTREVKRARFKLDEMLSQYHELWVYANRYTQSGARRLSPRQHGLVQSAKATIDKNLKKVAEAGQVCYDDPTLNCIEEVNSLNPGGENALQTVDRKVFVIENETFAQFCDDGVSPSPYSPPTLKQSVAGYLALAKAIKGEAFLPPQPNVAIDECFAAGTVFLGLTKLNASGRNISDLRPLMEFTQLEWIDLSDNEIESLEPFELGFVKANGGFARLKELNLHRNRVRDLKALKTLTSLELLNLSNNKITRAEELKELPHLLRVDLRNNSQDLKVTLLPHIVVLTADHGNSPIFADLPRITGLRRFAHQASALANGNVLVTGGIFRGGSGNGAELYESKPGSFVRLAGMAEARMWHTMSALKDGRLVALGGLGSSTGEIFDPLTNSFRSLRRDMISPRAGHSATRLEDGRLLLAGGWRLSNYGDVSLSAEVFNPEDERFTALDKGLSVPRAGHAATLLADGRVLFTGGVNDDGSTNTADVYDPATQMIRPLGRRMQARRAFHTATTLADGKVLLIGGIEGNASHASAEVFDPRTDSFRLLDARMKHPRMGHQAVLMDSGIVAVLGGSATSESVTSSQSCSGCQSTVEIFDPATRDFSLGNHNMVRPRVFHTVTALGDNRFLIVGGLGERAGDTAEILTYSPPNGN